MSSTVSDSHESIYVPVESDGIMYEFHGPDAEERHDRWALTGEPVYDAAVPIE